MDARDLVRSIVLQRDTGATKDGAGHTVPNWTTLATCAASFKAVSDAEKFSSSQVNSNISARFVIRYSTLYFDLNPKDRLVFDGKSYDILGVKEIVRRRWFEITAAAATS